MAHLEIKKMKQGMSYSCKEKTIILNVFKYFRNTLPEKCVTDIVRRTSKATGCSEKSIFQFRKEEASVEGFKEPSKTKVRKNININSRDIKYDSNVRQTIRNIIYDLKYRNIVPSLNTILKHVNADEQLPNFSLMTLRRLMFDMGFYYEKSGNKSILTEKNFKQENNPINRMSELQNINSTKDVPSAVPQVSGNVTSNHHMQMPNLHTHPSDRAMAMSFPIHENNIHTSTPHTMPMVLNHRRDFMPLPPHNMMPVNIDPHLKRESMSWMNTQHVIKQQ